MTSHGDNDVLRPRVVYSVGDGGGSDRRSDIRRDDTDDTGGAVATGAGNDSTADATGHHTVSNGDGSGGVAGLASPVPSRSSPVNLISALEDAAAAATGENATAATGDDHLKIEVPAYLFSHMRLARSTAELRDIIATASDGGADSAHGTTGDALSAPQTLDVTNISPYPAITAWIIECCDDCHRSTEILRRVPKLCMERMLERSVTLRNVASDLWDQHCEEFDTAAVGTVNPNKLDKQPATGAKTFFVIHLVTHVVEYLGLDREYSAWIHYVVMLAVFRDYITYDHAGVPGLDNDLEALDDLFGWSETCGDITCSKPYDPLCRDLLACFPGWCEDTDVADRGKLVSKFGREAILVLRSVMEMDFKLKGELDVFANATEIRATKNLMEQWLEKNAVSPDSSSSSTSANTASASASASASGASSATSSVVSASGANATSLLSNAPDKDTRSQKIADVTREQILDVLEERPPHFQIREIAKRQSRHIRDSQTQSSKQRERHHASVILNTALGETRNLHGMRLHALSVAPDTPRTTDTTKLISYEKDMGQRLADVRENKRRFYSSSANAPDTDATDNSVHRDTDATDAPGGSGPTGVQRDTISGDGGDTAHAQSTDTRPKKRSRYAEPDDTHAGLPRISLDNCGSAAADLLERIGRESQPALDTRDGVPSGGLDARASLIRALENHNHMLEMHKRDTANLIAQMRNQASLMERVLAKKYMGHGSHTMVRRGDCTKAGGQHSDVHMCRSPNSSLVLFALSDPVVSPSASVAYPLDFRCATYKNPGGSPPVWSGVTMHAPLCFDSDHRWSPLPRYLNVKHDFVAANLSANTKRIASTPYASFKVALSSGGRKDAFGESVTVNYADWDTHRQNELMPTSITKTSDMDNRMNARRRTARMLIPLLLVVTGIGRSTRPVVGDDSQSDISRLFIEYARDNRRFILEWIGGVLRGFYGISDAVTQILRTHPSDHMARDQKNSEVSFGGSGGSSSDPVDLDDLASRSGARGRVLPTAVDDDTEDTSDDDGVKKATVRMPFFRCTDEIRGRWPLCRIAATSAAMWFDAEHNAAAGMNGSVLSEAMLEACLDYNGIPQEQLSTRELVMFARETTVTCTTPRDRTAYFWGNNYDDTKTSLNGFTMRDLKRITSIPEAPIAAVLSGRQDF